LSCDCQLGEIGVEVVMRRLHTGVLPMQVMLSIVIYESCKALQPVIKKWLTVSLHVVCFFWLLKSVLVVI